MGGHIRAGALALTISVGIAAASVVVTAAPAHADQGLGEKGRARYVVTDRGAPVRVTQEVTVTNRQPSTATRYFYWVGYPLWLPTGATRLKATSNGATIPSSVIRLKGQDFAEIRFPSPLRYGQTRTFTVTYTIAGSPPRSARPGRVGRGYASLDVYSPGEAGKASIEIVSPRWMTLDLGVTYTEKTTGDSRVATARGGGPNGLWSLMSLRDPSEAAKRTVKVDNHSFSVVAFPGDTRWSAHISTRLPATVRELERLTGQDWPTPSTTITEDYSGQVYGWDGAYNRGAIDVAESLDHALLAHELAHAWSNYDHLEERWLTEGLAQELATQTMSALGGKDASHARVRSTQKGAFPLTEWPDGNSRATVAEDYGYPASWRVVHDLVAGSGKASKPELFRALTSERSIYDAPGDRTVATHETTWRQAYDVFEVLGGNAGTRRLMTTWVVDADGAQVLSARDKARRAYAAQDRLDGDWKLPRGVRSAMYDWSFTEAQRELARSGGLAGKAVQAQAAASRYGIDAAAVRAAYQEADGAAEYRAVDGQLVAFTRDVARYAALRAEIANANPLTRLAGLVVDPADQLETARTSIEKGDAKAADRALDTAASTTGRATAVGAGLLAALLAVAAGLGVAVRQLRRRIRAGARQAGEPALTDIPTG